MRPLLTALCLLLAGTALAQSPTETCVEIKSDRPDQEGLKRLVLDELDRHPTHHSAETGCLSFLRVEIFTLKEGVFVTGRINDQVPHRERVEGDDLPGAIEQLLTVVLHNDPVRLRGPRDDGWLRRRLNQLKAGRTLFGLELAEVGALVDGTASMVPSVGFSFRREVDNWHLGIRLAGGGRFDDPRDLTLVGHVAAQVLVANFPFEDAAVAPYWALVGGLEHQRYRGKDDLGEPGKFDQTGLALGARVGLELLRFTDTRVDLFGQVALPVFKTTDEETGVIDAWTPTATVGCGALF